MAKTKKSVKSKNFITKFADRHDEEIAHIVIFIVVGVIFFGSYALVGSVTAIKSVQFLQDKLSSLQQIRVNGPDGGVEILADILPRRLDGIFVAREEANRPPTCVMIENAAFGGVRPQAGLTKAPVVYELIVEGGITRLMGVFDGDEVGTIGPVRSARDTYLEFVAELNCAYVHAGGSFTAMRALQEFTLRDIDGLMEPGYFWRDPGKPGPHDLFTSSDKLRQAVEDHSWNLEEPPNYDSWLFVDPLPSSVNESASSGESEVDAGQEVETVASDNSGGAIIDRVYIGFGGSYDVEYQYMADENHYKRMNGGVEHTDVNTGEVITTKNIIIQQVGEGIPIQGKGRINWPVAGEGDVKIFHDGKVYEGKWVKPDRLGRTKFYSNAGDEIPLVRGNSWVEIVPGHIPIEFD